METMQAMVFDNELRLVLNWPVPRIKPDYSLIKVELAGICKTDLEIIKGYMAAYCALPVENLRVVDTVKHRIK